MCFVDYQKAFVCVRWSQLGTILKESSVLEHLLLIVRKLYDIGYGTSRVADSMSGLLMLNLLFFQYLQ